MPDYHILEKSANSRYVRLAIHLPIPASQNVAGQVLSDATLTYQKALSESLDSTVSIAPGITGAEQTALDNGSVFEKVHSFRFSSLELTNAERRIEIEDGNDNEPGVTQWKADISNSDSELYKEIIEPLAWWGYYRDV